MSNNIKSSQQKSSKPTTNITKPH